MEMVVVIAISVLGVVFLGALAALVMVCRHKLCKPIDLISQLHAENARPNTVLVENMEEDVGQPSGVQLNAVGLSSDIELVLHNQDLLDDTSGLTPYCLAILKTAHQLTEKLVGMTMGNAQQQLRSPEKMTELVAMAKRIGPRVDEVVKAMQPPLDPRLLEARCSALILSVSHLVLITKSACHLSGVLDWIDQSLADAEENLKVLREASANYEETLAIATRASLESLSVPGRSPSRRSVRDLRPPAACEASPQHCPSSPPTSQPDVVHNNLPRTESSSQV